MIKYISSLNNYDIRCTTLRSGENRISLFEFIKVDKDILVVFNVFVEGGWVFETLFFMMGDEMF